ncbi:MAG: hypothetical protein MI723_08435 [Caulobacterales bacterium]|nr:hypothetical protein [Caulobacterales bacterium]
MRHLATAWVMAGAALVMAGCAGGVGAPRQPGEPAPPAAVRHSDAFSALSWRFVGPMIGGRVNAVVGHPEKKAVFYAGYTGGGVWMTTDAGSNWTNISDGYFKTGSIGAMDISLSNPDILYVGTGEHALRGDVSHGDGVYKSTDGGRSWVNVGLKETRQIPRLIIHPTDPDTVYVGALGHFAGPNPERGVFKTTDGGETWERIFFQDERSGVVDLIMDKTNPDHLYAATWEVRRFPWGIRSGGEGSRIYRTTDAGETWEEITENPGLPKARVRERIGLALTEAKRGRVYALISSDAGKGLYRSDDGGDSWEFQTDDIRLFARAYYYMHIQGDPNLADRVYVMAEELFRSDDAGATFEDMMVGHSDHHDLYIDPADPDRIVDGQDHGALISLNGGETWSSNHNQPTAQMYTLTTDNRFPYWLYGAAQDWGSYKVSSWPRGGRTGVPYESRTADSEGGYTAMDPDDPNVLFISDHHWMHRLDQATGSRQFISPSDELHYGWGAADQQYRFFWVFPVFRSRHDGALYAGSQYVHRSADEGHSWEVISQDLTAAEAITLERTPLPGVHDEADNPPFWGPLTRDSNGDNWNATLYTMAESPLRAGLIWTGSDDGLIHVTRNGGESWENVTPPDLPARTIVSRIDPSPMEPGAAYVAATRYKVDDMRPYMWRTEDYGATWRAIADGIPEDDFVRVVRADPTRPGLLFAGTETSVYFSLDDGESWERMQSNLPHTPIHDLEIKDGDLVVATHGRGFWILDDISVFRQMTDETRAATHLYKPRDTKRYSPTLGPSALASPQIYGVFVDFNLAEPAESVSLRFSEADGDVIRTFTRENAPAGLNRFIWSNQRYPGAEELEGHPTRSRRRIGARALPGDYRVELLVGDEVLAQDFALVADPNIDTPISHLQEQFDFAIAIRDTITDLNRTVLAIREIRAGLFDRSGVGAEAELRAAQMSDALYLIESVLTAYMAEYRMQYHAIPVRLDDKLYILGERVVTGDRRPTEAQRELFADFQARYGAARADLAAFLRDDLAAFNAMVGEGGAEPVAIPAHLR